MRTRRINWNQFWILVTRRTYYSRKSAALRDQEEIPFLLNNLKLTGQGTEIGVFEGYFSEILLQHWRGQPLCSVDPYREYAKDAYHDVLKKNQETPDQIYAQTRQHLSKISKRSILLRGESLEVARLMSEDSFDFIYIDGNHSYKAVLTDLNAWYPLLVPGG